VLNERVEQGSVHIFCKFFSEVKGKAVPLQARRGPEGSCKLRFPTAQDGG